VVVVVIKNERIDTVKYKNYFLFIAHQRNLFDKFKYGPVETLLSISYFNAKMAQLCIDYNGKSDGFFTILSKHEARAKSRLIRSACRSKSEGKEDEGIKLIALSIKSERDRRRA
jgi:hypothetical protein